MTDPGLGFVTITSVDTTARLRARDRLRLGARQRRSSASARCGRWSARQATLQARVGREVTLRRTPRLRFAYDETFDKGRAHRAAAGRARADAGSGARGARRRGSDVTRGEVIEVLRDGGPVCVCAHASPDGDALGSLLGLGLSLAATGRDVVLYQDGDEPFPRELAFLQLDRIAAACRPTPPARTLIALDCGSALRIDRRGEVAGQFARVVNIDHHHDNTLFGTDQPGRRRGLLHGRDRHRAAGRGRHPAGRRRARWRSTSAS